MPDTNAEEQIGGRSYPFNEETSHNFGRFCQVATYLPELVSVHGADEDGVAKTKNDTSPESIGNIHICGAM